MAFWGCEFIFDDIPCSEYGLMIYDFGSNGQEDVMFKSGTILEDRLPSRYDSLDYGLQNNEPLEYNLVFGANVESIDEHSYLDRFDVEVVAAWLTGHENRKWLTICQSDMQPFRYKCYITELKLICDGDVPWAFSCKVSCDSPFGYTMPIEDKYVVNGTEEFKFFNRSSRNGYFMPKMEINVFGGETVTIENLTDNSRKFEFTNLSGSSDLVIYIDNKNQVITNNMDLNLYPNFNMKFMRVKRGENILKITGNAEVKFISEFPVNIGG